jgi:undecaprenyl-diphosphatase
MPNLPDVVRAVLLGVLQGLTEFLPVSSSGHLVILPYLVGWPDPGLTFDAVVHGGTALAVLLHLASDWKRLLGGALRSVKTRKPMDDPGARLLVLLAVGTVPAVAAGVALEDTFAQLFQSPRLAALMLLLTGGLLLVAERLGRGAMRAESLAPSRALGIGVLQALAMIPGISRSGATIAGGQLVGLSRPQATRFSFLLAGPVAAAAAIYRFAQLPGGESGGPDLVVLGAGFAAALVSGYWAVGWLMDFVRRAPLNAFALYTWVFGLMSLWLMR